MWKRCDRWIYGVNAGGIDIDNNYLTVFSFNREKNAIINISLGIDYLQLYEKK